MTAQTHHRPDHQINAERGADRKPLQIVGPIALLLAMAIAGFIGVAVVAYVTNPPVPVHVATQEPNADEREGRVPVTATHEPNANEREGRVPVTATHEPNANEREGRVPVTATHEPNANEREGRVSGNG